MLLIARAEIHQAAEKHVSDSISAFDSEPDPLRVEPTDITVPTEAKENRESPTPKRPVDRVVPILFVWGVVLVLCLLANLLLPGVFWYSTGNGEQYLAIFAAGGLAAQIGLLALWCAIGVGRFKTRLLVTTFLATLVSCSYLGGLRLPDTSNGGLPLSVGLFILGIGVCGFLLAALMLAGVSWLTGERLVLDRNSMQATSESRKTGDQSYSIAYLIGATTIIAVVIALLKAVLPDRNDNIPTSSEFIEACLNVLQHAVLSILIVTSCTVLALKSVPRGVGWLAATLLFALPADLLLMTTHQTYGQVTAEVVALLVSYVLGLTTAMLLFLALMRYSGLRLEPRQ